MRALCATLLLLLSGCTLNVISRPTPPPVPTLDPRSTRAAEHSRELPQAVAHCFELAADVRIYIYESPREVTLKPGGKGPAQPALQFVDGYFDPFPEHEAGEPPVDESYAFAGRQGSRVTVEKMLDKHLRLIGIGDDPWPYVRLGPEYGNILLYAESLFETPLEEDGPLRPRAGRLRLCE